MENKAQKVLCEATLLVDGAGQIHQTSACGKIAACILCRSCSSHCHGHNQLRHGLKARQFEYIQSNGQSEV